MTSEEQRGACDSCRSNAGKMSKLSGPIPGGHFSPVSAASVASMSFRRIISADLVPGLILPGHHVSPAHNSRMHCNSMGEQSIPR